MINPTTGHCMPCGQPGELCYRGCLVMQGSYRMLAMADCTQTTGHPGVPKQFFGEDLLAVIIPRAGAVQSEEDVRAYCNVFCARTLSSCSTCRVCRAALTQYIRDSL